MLLLLLQLIVLLSYGGFTGVLSFCPPSPFLTRHGRWSSPLKASDKDDDRRMQQKGLDDALRRLDALGGDAFKEDAKELSEKSPPITVSPDVLSDVDTTPSSPSLESEAKIYGELMGELDENEQSESYNEMMEGLGGQAKQTFDTYNSVLQEMGGTPPSGKGFGKGAKSTIPDFISKELLDEKGTEQFMENALKEAIKEVKLNNPEFSKEVLSDKSIMNEIEKIFEEGNEKLVASIEEIKREQRELVEQANAKRNADSSNDDKIKKEAERLLAAEASMQKILQKVDTEASQVEQAVADLTSANAELEHSFLYKLKAGGLPKQISFVGILFFAVRSILDSVTAVTSDDPASLTTALIQGGIALVCALLYAIL